MPDKPSVTLIRVSNADLEQILNEMEHATGSDAGVSKRLMRRWSLNGIKAVLTLVESTGQQKHLMAVPRNLSTMGIGCIIGSFIHVGTRCVVSLRDLRGDVRSLSGKVMRCKHVRGTLHDIGVTFDVEVQPEDFREFHGEHQFHRENVRLDLLRGTIAVAEESILDQKLIAAYFKNSDLELTFAHDAESTMSVLAESPDMMMVDYHLPDIKGTELIAKIRESGYIKPIILLTSDDSPTIREQADRAGASEILIKPVTPDLIHRAAAEYLIGGRGLGSIRSARDETIINDEMVDEFVKNLHKIAHELSVFVKEDAINEIRYRSNQIRSTATGYGFGQISELADLAIKSLDATASVSDSVRQLNELISACQRAVPPIAEVKDSPAENTRPGKMKKPR